MKTVPSVGLDLVEEAVWPPGLCPEGDGHRLTKVIKLTGGSQDNLRPRRKHAHKWK